MLWALSLAGAVALGARAQAPEQQQAPQAPPVVVTAEWRPVLSGADIGFRVERMERGRAVGTLLVKMGGEWVEVTGSTRVVPLR